MSNTDPIIPVLILGAGPAGLATAGRLREAGIAFEVLEKSQRVGNAWHEHYDRLHLHTVKELSHLPGLPFPDDYPRYVSREQLARYLSDYAQHFGIIPHFGVTATHLQRHSSDCWEVKTSSGKIWLAEHVVVATGVNHVPYRPSFPEEAAFKGTILHSKNYQNPEPYWNQRVLVVGMGNTGAEIALDLADRGVTTFLSVRGPVNIVPRDVLGRPTQQTALMLAKLPTWLADSLGVVLRKVTVGDLSKYGISTPAMPPAKQLRVTGKTPVVDLGTVKAIKAGRIKVVPAIDSFTPAGVKLQDGQDLPLDTVILATGYQARLRELLPEAPTHHWDDFDLPRSWCGEGHWEKLYFIGFDNYTAGGILGVINRDSRQIVQQIQQPQLIS